MKPVIFAVIFGFCCEAAASPVQDSDSVNLSVEEDLERVLENKEPEEAGLGAGQYAEFLQDLAAHPVNINRAGPDRLLLIPGLTLRDAGRIVQYREQVKAYETKRELLDVPGIGAATLEKIRSYITVGSPWQITGTLAGKPGYWIRDGHLEYFSRFQTVLQTKKGFELFPAEGGYLGMPGRYYQRLSYRSRHLSLNITQEKDHGEPLMHPGDFDFNSGHLAIREAGIIRELVLGDYDVSFGHGLVLGAGSAFGKGREVGTSILFNHRGVHPYTSSTESGFFRGGALTLGDKIQITGFYSRNHLDASEWSADTVRFPGTDGYHRTISDRAKKGNVSRLVTGGRVQGRWPSLRLGVTGYQAEYDTFILPGIAVYHRYRFRGRKTSAIGLDYSLMLRDITLFGEGVRTGNGGSGILAGMDISVNDNSHVVATWRNYEEDLQAVFGSGFSEQSGAPQNENGFYAGFTHRAGRVILAGWLDQYRFPAPRFGTHRPTSGFDWLGIMEYKANEDLEFYFRLQGESREVESDKVGPFGRSIRVRSYQQKKNIRVHLQYQVHPDIRIRLRGEWLRYKSGGKPDEYGYLLFQDFRIRPLHRDILRLDARITFFDTQGYNSRLFQYENDLLYVFGSRMLHGKGQRMYILAKWEPFSFLDLWAKFGVTIYEDQQTIGTGLEQIRGNVKSEVGVQIRLRL